MASSPGIPTDRKRLWKLIVEGFSFFAALLAVVSILGVSVVALMMVLLVLLVLIIIHLLDENRRLQKEVWKRGLEQGSTAPKMPVSHPFRKRSGVSLQTKHKRVLPADVILKKKFGLGYEEYKEYGLDLRKNAKVRIQIESSQPINAYFLDKWHFDRPETWNKTQWKDTSIYEFDETVCISKAGKWFIVCEALDEPADIVLSTAIIEKGEEQEKPKWLRLLDRN